jgi:hypothetical protein
MFFFEVLLSSVLLKEILFVDNLVEKKCKILAQELKKSGSFAFPIPTNYGDCNDRRRK